MSDESSDIVTWRGRRIEELTHAELLAAFCELGSLFRSMQESHLRSMETWQTFIAARKRRPWWSA